MSDLIPTKTQIGLGNVNNTSDANKPVSTAQQTALDLKQDIATLPFTKLAHATGVNGAVLASTTLTFETSITLAGYIPTHAVIKFGSGTLGISVVILNANAVAVTASQALVGLFSTTWMIMPIVPGIVSNTGNLTIQVTTASLGASTFDIEVFGIKY